MDSLLAFLIATTLTFYFVRRYLRSLAPPRSSPDAPGVPAAPAASAGTCPRCGQALTFASAFCPACGASMALWNVHRAAVQGTATAESEGQQGKPRPIINATLCIGCGSCVDECPETGTLALANGKAILAHPDRCVGHARCVEVCPTSALQLAFGSKLQTLRVPLVREDFETNVSGIFIAGELSGMGLIKTAINEGRLAVDCIRRRLEESGEWEPPAFDPHKQSNGNELEEHPPDQVHDVVIVGAGPAGLSAALTAQQHGLDYLVLEQGEVAATIRNYPRHKFLMAEPVEMPLYGNLYVGDGTKESLLKVWEAIVANTGVRIRTNERVESICRRTGWLEVTANKRTYRARHVVLALGKRGTPRRLGVPGEDLGKVAYRLIEADSYDHRDILVVGGGDSAIEAAVALSKAEKNRVTLSYRGASFDRARDRNRKLLEEAERQNRIRILRNSKVTDIQQDCVNLTVEGQPQQLPNHFVFIMAGGESPEEFLRKVGIEIVEKAVTALEEKWAA